jgi:hypothetical protein
VGWLEKFVAGSGLSPSREACERFWKEQVRAKPRGKWQLDQWGAAMRWYVRWLVSLLRCFHRGELLFHDVSDWLEFLVRMHGWWVWFHGSGGILEISFQFSVFS